MRRSLSVQTCAPEPARNELLLIPLPLGERSLGRRTSSPDQVSSKPQRRRRLRLRNGSLLSCDRPTWPRSKHAFGLPIDTPRRSMPLVAEAIGVSGRVCQPRPVVHCSISFALIVSSITTNSSAISRSNLVSPFDKCTIFFAHKSHVSLRQSREDRQTGACWAMRSSGARAEDRMATGRHTSVAWR
jgi:hypothetical protein